MASGTPTTRRRVKDFLTHVYTDYQRRTGFLLGVAVSVILLLLAESLLPLGASDGEIEKGELVIMADRDQSLGRQRHKLLEEWNARHPDSRARIVEVPASATAARSQMVAHGQSGAAPAVDVYSLDVTWTAEFASAGLIRPLDESRLDTAGFLDAPLESCRYDGKLWALPFNTDAGLLFYRQDLFSEPPETWSDLKEKIGEYFERTPDPDASDPDNRTDPAVSAGYTGQFADYEGLTVNALEIIWAEGGDVVDQTGEVAPIEHMSPGVRWIAQGAGDPGDRVILPESLDYDEDRSRQAFQQGRVLFMRNWPVAYRHLTSSEEGEAPPMDPAKVGVAKLPGRSVLGGQNLAVAAGTDKPRAAQRLIEFLTSARSQQKLFEHGGFAPTQEVVYYDSARRTQAPYLEPLLESVQDARPRPVTKHYEQFSSTFRQAVRAALGRDGDLPHDTERSLADALKGRRAPP